MARYNNGMRLSRFVANEVKLLEEILNGREIPNYYNAKEISRKLFKLYVEEKNIEYNEAIENICNFLDSRNILYSRREIDGLLEWYDPKKIIPLRRYTTPLVFYKSEVDIIRGLEKREYKRMLLGFMLIAKIQRNYSNMKEPNCIYYTINEVAKFCGMNNEGKIRAVKELGLCGYVLAPFDKNCLVVNCLSDGDEEEVLSVCNFEPDLNIINDIFIQLVGKQEKRVMAIPLDDEEDWVVFNGVREASRGIGATCESDISKCCKLDRLQCKQYMFFLAEEDDSDEFLDFVAHYYQHNIANNYRRMKKDGSLMGTKIIFLNKDIIRDIYNKFMSAIEEQ